MAERQDADLLRAVRDGDVPAFEQLYALYQQRVRVTAWRISHRGDWVEDLVSEAWARAFSQRQTFDDSRSFLVWMAGILQNVYREQCRKSPLTLGESVGESQAEADSESPESVAAEAELLVGLNDCVNRLSKSDADLVRLRFFDGKPLRLVAQELNVPESTLREARLPAVLRALRRCMAEKGLKISEIFPAQEGTEDQ